MQPHLQHPLREARLLGQLLEVLGVRVLVDGKVRLHRPQLVVLERGPHPLGPAVRGERPAGTGRLAAVVRGQIEAADGQLFVQKVCKKG